MTEKVTNTLAAAPRLRARQFVKAASTRPSCDAMDGSIIGARPTLDPTPGKLSHEPVQDSEARLRKDRTSGIVCGTDFSIHAREAADVAAVLASKLSADLTLIHVTEPVRGEGTSRSLHAMLRYKGRNKLRNEAERLRGFGITVEDAFASGFPAAELVKCAIRKKAGLVVVSSVGSLLPTRWLLGSVAEQTAQLSPAPVLVVRDPKPFKAWAAGKRSLNILVGHDFSSGADGALGWVASLRTIGRCRITVAHLSTPQLTTGWLEVDAKLGSKKSLVEIREMLRADLVQRCRGPLGNARFRVEVITVRDSVASRLVSLAKALGADFIVVGTNQKSPLRRLCLGSVSRGVLRETLVSVACVPPARS